MFATIGALRVEHGGIGYHRKENLHQLSIADLAGIIDDPNRFGVIGQACADQLVGCAALGAAMIAGRGTDDAFRMFEHTLDTPEATTGKYGHGAFATFLAIDARLRNDRRFLRRMGLADKCPARNLLGRQPRLHAGPDRAKAGDADAKHDGAGEDRPH